MNFFRTMTIKTKERIESLLELFSDRLVAEYDEYQDELTDAAEKYAEEANFKQSQLRLLDGDVKIETELNDQEIDLGEKFETSEMTGVAIADERTTKGSYQRTAIFLHYLMKASTTAEFDAIAECFPDMVGDRDVNSYFRLYRREIAFHDMVEGATTVEELEIIRKNNPKRMKDEDVAAYIRLREYDIKGIKLPQTA